MVTRLKSFSIRGFKSIQNLDNFEPAQVNLLIGQNGAGKSNLIAFFRLLSWMVHSERFQNHIGMLGGGSAILFDGPEVTPQMIGDLIIETDSGMNEYHFRLSHAAGDTLIFVDEKVRFSNRRMAGTNPKWFELGSGHRESKLPYYLDKPFVFVLKQLLQQIVVYQFHNTTDRSQIRNRWAENDGRFLKENGANLGSFLFRLQKEKPAHYQRIIAIIRQAIPFFLDFELADEFGFIQLRWREKDSPKLFDASEASDGMLRFMALTALLLQPVEDLPAVIFIDEPELGLHPAAINILASLIKKASNYAQLFISTQSDNLVNEFSPEEVVVVEREGRKSIYKRLNSNDLSGWLSEYNLGQLWEQNVIGGRP